MTTIRVALPTHLRNLAGVGSEVAVEVLADAPTMRDVLDALEAMHPQLRGTIRDQVTGERRAYMRLFGGSVDLSPAPPDRALPIEVADGRDVLRIVGAIAGG